MFCTCYLRNAVVYVPALGQRGGAYTVIEPVAVVQVNDTDALRSAFRDAAARKIVDVPLIKGKWPPPVLPKYAGVKTSAAFDRGTSTWNIQEDNEKYKIVGYRRHPDGYWVEDRAQTNEFPAGTSLDDVIDRMIAILQDAARRPQND
jgi:hypothetical protein